MSLKFVKYSPLTGDRNGIISVSNKHNFSYKLYIFDLPTIIYIDSFSKIETFWKFNLL